MDYKQQSNQGCLVVDLLYLFGEEPTKQKEEEILTKGLFAFRDNYTVGCLIAFLDMYSDKRVRLYFDNNYYLNIIKNQVSHPRITMVKARNDISLIDTLSAPFIVYTDTNITDGFTHLPHFMMVTGVTEKMFSVFDPWTGKVSRMSKQRVLKGIDLLRSHVKVCPFIITIDQDETGYVLI